MTSGGLLLAAIDLLHEVLDEVLLILGGGVDGRTLSGLGLLTTGNGEPGTGEHAAEGGHGEDVGADLLAGDLVVDNHFVGLELRYSERFNWQRCGRNPQAWTERRGRHGYRLS